MRKFLIIFLIAPFLMGMKVIYKNQTGEIKAIGPFVDYKVQDGESIIEVPEATPEKISSHVVDKGIFREKTEKEKSDEQAAKDQKKNEIEQKKQAVGAKLSELDIDINGLRALVRGE